jgi:hypothetical protein
MKMEWPGCEHKLAGLQYRALAHLAHYYFLTEEQVAKDVLKSWMTWLSSRILGDGAGWKVPLGLRQGHGDLRV